MKPWTSCFAAGSLATSGASLSSETPPRPAPRKRILTRRQTITPCRRRRLYPVSEDQKHLHFRNRPRDSSASPSAVYQQGAGSTSSAMTRTALRDDGSSYGGMSRRRAAALPARPVNIRRLPTRRRLRLLRRARGIRRRHRLSLPVASSPCR